jgi:stearoyl-CoA desaturase (delta-9 desaturase)
MQESLEQVKDDPRGQSEVTPREVRPAEAPPLSPIDWPNVLLLALVHVAAIGGTAVYLALHGLTLAALLIGISLTVVSIFAISAGYHRLFSHRAYEAHPVFRFLLLVFGAGTFQRSALGWAADHRRHHAKTDSDRDPYDARRGFWYSHIGWVLRQADPNPAPVPMRDLERDPLVSWQHRHFALIGIAAGLVLPTLLGLLWGDPWGGFVIGAAVRLLLVYHATFSINSFAHLFGSQPYSDRSTARDSLLTALISMGEGYHNFHHTFPGDYRNGVRAHQFDPTKWILRTLAALGVVRTLRRTPAPAIVRARLRMDEQRLAARAVSPAAHPGLVSLRALVEETVVRWNDLVARYEASRLEPALASNRRAGMRAEMRAGGREARRAYARWKRATRSRAGAFGAID